MCFNKLFKFVMLIILLVSFAVFSGCGGGNPIIPPSDETTTDEEFNDIIDTGENAIDKFEEYCNSIGEELAYQATVDFLEQQNGVKEAGIGEDGTTIWFEYENGYLVGILSTEEDAKANEKGIELPFDQSKVVPSAEKALILNPGFNLYATYNAQKIKGKLNSLYGEYDYESGLDVSIELMKELYQYSVIYINTHGGIIKGNESFCLKIEATTDIKDQYDYYFKNHYLVIGMVKNPIPFVKSKPYVCISPSFITDFNSGTFPDSLICIEACHSLENKTMAKAFEKKGAYVYCGFNSTKIFSDDTAVKFFENLISEEMNVEDAVDNLSNNNFKYYPENHGDLYLKEEILTPEEIELIRKWGFGGDYVVRWPNGYVDVYDATNYNQMQEVLNQWNSVIGGPVVFRLSSNPNSPVKVIFDSSLELEGFCGDDDVVWGDDYVFSEITLEVNPSESCCGDPNIKYCLYLVMFNAVAGFNYGAEVSPTPFEDWSNFNTIPDTIKTMLRALHKVPPGYYLGDTKQRKDRSNNVMKNIFTSGGGNCLDE